MNRENLLTAILNRKNWAVTALFLAFTGLQATGQTEPAKPQLPSTPMPGNLPPQQPSRTVIIQQETDKPEERKDDQVSESQVVDTEEPEEKYNVKFTDRLAVSGNFDLYFGDVTLVGLSPMVGYKFTDNFMAGPGVVYQYQKFRNYDGYHIYGGKAFARAMVFQDVLTNTFLHGEYEVLNLPILTLNTATNEVSEERVNVNSLFAGVGHRLMIGGQSSIDGMILFNLLHTENSPYSSPLVIRLGITGGW